MPGLKENLKGDEIRCLIYEIGNSDAVGFIDASTNMDNQETDAIYWNVFRHNIPSIKLAEKLGGKLIGEGQMLEMAFQMAGYEVEGEVKEKLDVLRELTYKIDLEDIISRRNCVDIA